MKLLSRFFKNEKTINIEDKLNDLSNEKLLNLEDKLNDLSNENFRLSQEIKSIKDSMWSLERETKSDVNNLENKFGWRKVVKKLPGWKNECEFIEMYAHVFVMDDGYRKILPPYIVGDSNGKKEILHKEYIDSWNGEYKMRCYMVTRLILPGYTKMEDLLTNDSRNFTMDRLFGKSYQELLSYMLEHKYYKKSEEMYTINFYEL